MEIAKATGIYIFTHLLPKLFFSLERANYINFTKKKYFFELDFIQIQLQSRSTESVSEIIVLMKRRIQVDHIAEIGK